MEFTIKSGPIDKQRSACIVVGVVKSRQLTPSAKQLDKVSRSYISGLLKSGDLKENIGDTLLLHKAPSTNCERILLVYCGASKDLDDSKYRKIVRHSITALSKLNIKGASICLAELNLKGCDLAWKIRQIVETSKDTLYRPDQLKTSKDKKPSALTKITIYISEHKDSKTAQKAILTGQAIANGVELAKTLGNLPGNICTPSYLAKQATALGKQHKKITIKILAETDMKRLKMGALLSVSRGSREPAKLITLTYRGGKKGNKPVVLVGKGITFDSGGISIKPGAAMDEMKFDMCGAASVLGTLSAIAEMQLAINVVGVIPTSENLPDGNASKPGDIVTSMSGQTIEVLNTDAEGRLVLCDALTYSERFKPDVVVDIATLTGACVIALGSHATGLLSNNEPLTKDLLKAGTSSGDRAWQMPLWEDYQKQLNSNFADMANIGGREAGTITAACFLARFTKKFKWAHLDIAGTAWKSGAAKGATGRPVPLLTQFLINRCN